MLKTKICGIELRNPIILASGVAGYGKEYQSILSDVGAVSVKGLSLNYNIGNDMPRICETEAGMLNAIGLNNIGVNRFLEEELSIFKGTGTKVIANFWGKTDDEYVEVARILDSSEVDMLEMNISCPNVKEGGIVYGSDVSVMSSLVKKVRSVIKNKPLCVKLSPNVTSIVDFAVELERIGVDVISAINTLIGMAIDIYKKSPKLANKTGGYSGIGIKPVAVAAVYRIYDAVKIPILGIGGIYKWEDAIEFAMAGASAVQVGTALFKSDKIPSNIALGIEKYLISNNYNSWSDTVGIAH